MKYLIMEDFSGKPAAFIFPDRVNHEDMREQLPYIRVLSGGQITLGENGFICSGGCPELGLASGGQDDADFIATSLGED